MKKEVLLSLLMTTPVAFPALADISLGDKTLSGANGAAWKSEASSFIDGYKDLNGTGMYCPVGIKSISRTLTLPQGKYSIELIRSYNCKLIVNENSANANVVVETNKQKEVTGFTVKAGTKEAVSVKIVPVNAKKDSKGKVIEEDFYFDSLDLNLVFSSYIVYNETYNSAFQKLAWPQNIRTSSNTSDAAVALRKERPALTDAYNKAVSSLNDIWNAGLDAYIKYELWATPNKVVTSTKELASRIDEYNKKVEAENVRYDNYNINTSNKQFYTRQQSYLVRNVENLGKEIDRILADKTHKDYQYVKDQDFAGQCKELAASLPAIKTLIETTYPEELLGTAIDASELADKFNAAHDKYETLSSYLHGASADMLAYQHFKDNNQYLGTDGLYAKYQQAVIDLSKNPAPDKSGYPDNAFAEKVVEHTTAIDADFKKAQDFIKIEVDKNGVKHAVLKNIAGASGENGRAALATQAIEKAFETIKTELAKWKEFTEAQNAQMKLAYSDVKKANDDLAATKKAISVPAQFVKDYEKLTDAVTAAIAIMKTTIDAAYGIDLDAATSYAKEKEAVDKAQAKLDQFAADAQRLTQVYASYNDLKASVEKVDVDKFLAGLYANDYAEIDAMFNGLKKINDDASIKKIEDRIAELESASKNLVTAFKNANVMTDYNSFLTYVESGKTILNPASTAWKTVEADMKKANVPAGVTEINNKINAIIAAHTPNSVMDTYNSIVALNEKAAALKGQIKDFRADFTKKASEENLAYAQSKLNYIKQVLANAVVVVKDKPADAQKAVETLQGKIDAEAAKIAGGDPTKEADYAKFDKNIKDTFIGKDIPAIEKLIQKTIDNYKAYVDLTSLNDNLKKRVVALSQLNQDLSKDPAKGYYDGLIDKNAKKTGYFDKVDAFKKQIEDANKATDEKKNAAALKGQISSDINTYLKGTVEPMFDKIRLNEESHNDQLLASSRVRTVLDNIEDQLEKRGEFNPFADQIKKLSESLLALDRQVTAEYGKGASNALSLGGIISKYDDIEKQANKIFEDFTPEYNKAIVVENERLLGEYGWTKLNKELTDTYNNSIKTFIDFAYNVTNLGYKAHIEAQGGFKNIQVLFDYQPQIGKIQTNVLNYVNGCNATVDKDGNEQDPKLINKDDLYNAMWVKLEDNSYINAEMLRDNMKSVGDIATNQANAFADSYWNILYPQATGNYATNESELEAGGVKDKYIDVPDPKDPTKLKRIYVVTVASEALSEAEAAIKAAKDLAYNKDKKGEYTNRKDALGKLMNEIADNLDKSVLFTVAEKQTIAMNMWVASHKATTDRLAEMNAAFATFDFVTAADKKAPKAEFDKAVAEIAKINGNAVKVNEGLLGEKLNGFMSQLAAQWNRANTQYTSVESKNATNKLNTELFDKYTGNIADLNKDFKALCDFGGTLAADNATLESISNKIAALQSSVNDNKADYSTAKTVIEKEIKNLKDNVIPAGYGSVARAEVRALSAMVGELRSSWAEASKDGKDIDLDAYRKLIDDFEAENILGTGDNVSLTERIIAIEDEAETVKDQVKPFVELGAEMRELEKELSDIQIALKKSWGKDVLKDLLDDLSKQYVAINNDIESLAGYDESLQKKYADAFADYKTRLDAIKAAWEKDGNNAIMQQDNYTDGMDALAKDVKKSLDSVKADQKVIDIHRATYADLKGKYDAQVNAVNAIKDRLDADDIFFVKDTEKKYENGDVVKDENGNPVKYSAVKAEYLEDIAAIEKLLAATLKDLEAQNKKGNMTPETSALKNWSKTTRAAIPVYTPVYEASKVIPDDVKNLNEDVLFYIEGQLAPVMTTELTALYDGIKAADILPDVQKDLITKYIALGEKARKAVVAPSEDKKNTTGEARINLAKSNISAVHGILDEAAALVAVGEKNTFLPGDLNRDGERDVLDVQEIINLVGEGVAYEDLEAVKAAAADTNRDGIIGVGDIAGVIAKAMELPDKTASRMAAHAVVDGANLVATEFVSEEGGVRRFAVNLTNSAAMVAGQIDLVLPDGMTLVEVVAAERAEAHDVALFHNGIANKRVILSNIGNAAIAGVNGAVVYVDVIGDGNLDVTNVIFADRASGEYRFAKPEGTSGIEDTVIDNNGGLKQRIYNAAGQALRSLQRGVNIIRNADGSVTKEYHK